MNLSSKNTPMVLLCPAWKRWGQVKNVEAQLGDLHSRNDEVIPFDDSEELIAASKLSSDALIEVGGDHRLADDASLQVMQWACTQLTSSDGLLRTAADVSNETMKQSTHSAQEAVYVCDSCGEEIVIPVDLSEGEKQQYVEDCPVCCHANIIHVEVNENASPVFGPNLNKTMIDATTRHLPRCSRS